MLRVLTLNTTSLWAAVVLQAALFNFLFFRVCRQVISCLPKPKVFLLLLILCATTALPWTVSVLIPDICTSIAFFCVFLILAQERPGLVVIPPLLYSRCHTQFPPAYFHRSAAAGTPFAKAFVSVPAGKAFAVAGRVALLLYRRYHFHHGLGAEQIGTCVFSRFHAKPGPLKTFSG